MKQVYFISILVLLAINVYSQTKGFMLNGDTLLYVNGTGDTIQLNRTVPSQAGQAGKVVSTNGTSYQWVDVQPPLVSNVNIKTVNNTSLLGSGNISISGGSADSATFYTVYRSDTSRANIYGALAGKQATITIGTTAQYLKGDLSLGTYSGYTLQGAAGNASTVTDAQTIHFGGTPGQAPSTTGGNHRLYIPKAGTITAAYVYANAGTAGTNEAWVVNIRLNNTTNTQIQSLSSNSANRLWSNTALSIAVVAGDYVEFQSVNPTWATNVANLRFSAVIYIE